MCPLEPTVQQRLAAWLRPPFDAEMIAELEALIEAGDERELNDRFYRDLEFGTGGLRGLMGAGCNRMNGYTVGLATQGLANHIRAEMGSKSASAVIAFDSRLQSDAFAREAACVLAGNGIGVFLFEALRPTPELSFAVRLLEATAGIVITASHNPKEYNGYKVYWSDGGQVVPPHDEGIIDEVRRLGGMDEVRRADYEESLESGLIQLIGEKVDSAYFEAILPLSIKPHVCRQSGADLKIVYSPLHGAGGTLMPTALARWGFPNVELVKSQAEPDGTFPTVAYPNPEEEAALSEALDTARASGAHLVLATDPDADRVGVAVRHEGEYRLLTGNQTAALLVDYVLGAHAERGSLLPEAAVVKTIVTSELVAEVARGYGVRVDNVLTGFKYIGEKIRQYEETGEAVYMAGGEESYGYLVGTHARDKDAIVCSCMIAEMAADALARGQTLIDCLDAVYRRCGIFQESLMSMQLPGAEGTEQIARIMASFRETPPTEFLGAPVVEIRDYQRREVRSLRDGCTVGPTGLPESDVLLFLLEDDTRIFARPSGTEPKIKFYFGVCDRESLPIPSPGELARRKIALSERHDKVREDFAARVRAIAGRRIAE